MSVAGEYYYGFITDSIRDSLGGCADVETLTVLTAMSYISGAVLDILLIALPVLLISAVLSIALVLAQTKINFAWERLKPDFAKINPIKGLKKMFTMRSLVELIKSIIKVTLIAVVVYTEIKSNFAGYVSLSGKSVLDSLLWISSMSYHIVIKAGIFLLGFGVLDYLYQWWEYERQLRMSFQELKEEYKQTEGDPFIKGRQKDRQRHISMLRISQKVPLADVIIRNPTHFAVALKYEAKKDKAPRLIAKGQDYLALKIIEIAEANQIPVSTNPPLARGLYQAVELDREIPEQYYQAVAEILVFVYTKIRGAKTIS